MSPKRPIEDLPDLLADLDDHLAHVPAALKAERRSRRWQVGMLFALLAAVLFVYLRGEQNRKDTTAEARCSIRTAVVSVAVSAGVGPAELDPIISDLDAAIGTAVCDPISICRDGTPSPSTGPGTCSHHGGVRSTVEPSTTKPGD